MHVINGYDEAAKDPRISQSDFQLAFNEQEIEGHRLHTVYFGVHLPEGGRRHSHRKQKRHHKDNGNKPPDAERPNTPPSQRVQLILGEGFDEGHDVHPLFAEMSELVKQDNEYEWMEMARWIKFEENVEEGGNRWSKPHVATLSLHSLFELRLLLLRGKIVLDMDAKRLDIIADKLSSMFKPAKGQKNELKNLLMRPHRHLHELKAKGKSARAQAEVQAIARDLLGLQHTRPASSSALHTTSSWSGLAEGRHSSGSHTSLPSRDQRGDYLTVPSSEEMARDPTIMSIEALKESRGNTHFMKKVPYGAEASNVLVGEVEMYDKPVVAFIRLKEAAVLGDLTEVPVPTRFIFLLLVPMNSNTDFREVGRAMSTLMSDEVFSEVAYRARKVEHILAGVDEFLDAVTVLPPGEWDPAIRIEPPATIPSQEVRKRAPDSAKEEIDQEEEENRLRKESGLTPSGRYFGGLINDCRRKLPWYYSDFKDAASHQCFATWIFLYFACLSPIITFGGLLSDATGKHIGAMESLVSGCVCGIIYGLFSGQPLNILGSTGPVLVFEAIVYDYCQEQGWDFLTFRLWIGSWIALILMILVAFDASFMVCYITRFTEENFACLIAVIFIYQAIVYILLLGYTHPVNPKKPFDCVCTPPSGSNDTLLEWAKYNKMQCESRNGVLVGPDCDKDPPENVILMTVILFLGTFVIAVVLRDFKNALFFTSAVRHFISDFACVTAIFGMTFLDYWTNVPTPKLEVPSKFKPTLPGRAWVITPFHEDNPHYSMFLAGIPALLGTILIFMDQQITAVIINRKENKLRKGCGYHLDLCVLAILIEICSCMGLPWFVASTVVSINHVDSLKVQSECAAPGEKPQFLGVREQRVTHVAIALTTGGSVFLIPILSLIPMPVLYGVFLYMGVASLKGLQLLDRFLIMFMPVKYQPDFMFLRQVPIRRVHLFTIIQLSCLMLLWFVKSIPQTSILFPLMLVVMVGIRKSLDNLFTRRELKILDDPMPEFGKSKRRSDRIQSDGGDKDNTHDSTHDGDTSHHIANMPVANGCVTQVPICITDESNRTKLWKQASHDKSQSIDTDDAGDTHLIIPTTLKVRKINGSNYQIRHVIRAKQITGADVRTAEGSMRCQRLPFESFI